MFSWVSLSWPQQKTTKTCSSVTRHSQVWCCRPIKCPIKRPVPPTGLTALVYPHRPRTSTSTIFTYQIIIPGHLGSCYNNWFAEPNNVLANGQKPSQGISPARPFHRGLDLIAVGRFANRADSRQHVMSCGWAACWREHGEARGGCGTGNKGPGILLMTYWGMNKMVVFLFMSRIIIGP